MIPIMVAFFCALWKRFLTLVVLALGLVAFQAEVAANEIDASSTFLQTHCADCHQGKDAEAGFDLSALEGTLNDENRYQAWIRLFDRVNDGEMPPNDISEVTPKERHAYVSKLKQDLLVFRQAQYVDQGRVRGRRLNNLQLERSLQDLLGIEVPLSLKFPEEPRVQGFTTIADGQAMSHYQLQTHLSVVDLALDAAFDKGLSRKTYEPELLDAQRVSRTNPKRRCREPELIDGLAVTWSSGLVFYGRLPCTTVREPGWYRFKVSAKAVNCPENSGVWCTVRTGQHVSGSPIQKWVGSLEATEEVQEWTLEAWLEKGEMLEIRPEDANIKKARFAGGQVGTGEGGPQNVPGVGIQSIEMQRINPLYTPQQTAQLLYGDMKTSWDKKTRGFLIKTDRGEEKLESLLKSFATRAFRRPVDKVTLQPYLAIAQDHYRENEDFLAALRVGYRTILCSPRFLYFQEQGPKLDDFEVATRLSYFLCNTTPDQKLFDLAQKGELSNPQELARQAERLLASKRGEEFLRTFAQDWLDLRLIDFTEPDRRLYPGFDVVVQQSMVEETVAYLNDMLKRNLSVTHLVDSDHTFLNSRLARYYGINQKVEGDKLLPVTVGKEDHRGGLITQGAVLKVTANGTNTSPVVRGIWISERILGQPIPDPPTVVAAIEPDIRGATTIREMLVKHQADPSCASCHKKIDPPGFALENFDPSGRWRNTYGAGRKKSKKAKPVDASSVLPDGREFKDLDDFKQLFVESPEVLARNWVEKLVTAGTGAPIDFADREPIQRIVAQAADSQYGVRDLLLEVISSPLFLEK